MGRYGVLWDTIGCYGAAIGHNVTLWGRYGAQCDAMGQLWGTMGRYGALWDTTGLYGSLWGSYGAQCGAMGRYYGTAMGHSVTLWGS